MFLSTGGILDWQEIYAWIGEQVIQYIYTSKFNINYVKYIYFWNEMFNHFTNLRADKWKCL